MAEGEDHRRQRKIISPAFSPQALRGLQPVFFAKALELRDALLETIPSTADEKQEAHRLDDIADWLWRATFDIVGLAGISPQLTCPCPTDLTPLRFQLLVQCHQQGVERDVLGLPGPVQEGCQSGIHPPHWPGDILPLASVRFRECASSSKLFLSNLLTHSLMSGTKRCKRANGPSVAWAWKSSAVEANALGRKRPKVAHGICSVSSVSYSACPLHSGNLTALSVQANLAESVVQNRLTDDELLTQITTLLFVGSDTTSVAMTW